ncbi:MAG: glycine cleavage system aminomethyltransferase GcvT [Clostridiales bacterium]|nr:glycine cleavage system aminomethyltransferase GcvT [Clostridiales bacterium]
MKKTPLYEKHLELSGKIVDFGGWALPVEYSGIIQEHEAVRNAAGLFDVSHMGEVLIEGKDAESFVQKMVTNDISTMKDFQIYYSPMCYEDGGVVDDLMVYKYNNEKYLLVINASNTEKDIEWLESKVSGDVKINNLSDKYALLALQGPKAEAILQKLTDTNLDDLGFFEFIDGMKLRDVSALVSRTGYTGEDGFEIYLAPGDAARLWDLIMEAGSSEGLKPAGLGARDTLRFEACLPLYGNELDKDITPLEGGLGYFVKLTKDDFIGKEALAKQKSEGLKRKVCCFEMLDRGIARSGYEIYSGEEKIGFVTSGTYSPTLKKNLGMAMLDVDFTEIGTEIIVEVRNRKLKAQIVKKPFYTKKYKKD